MRRIDWNFDTAENVRASEIRFGISDRPAAQWVTPDADRSNEFGGVDDYLSRSRRTPRLLVVDDDDVDRERIRRFAGKFRLPLVTVDAASGHEALAYVAKEPVDVILLDYQLGDMTGTDLLQQIREAQGSGPPIIMVTGVGDENTVVEALRLGVFDYIPKRALTVQALAVALESVLRHATLERNLQHAQARLRRLSLYDDLTGLPNRTLLFDRLRQLMLSCERTKNPCTLLMIDLNLFKEVNDDFGHAAGDEVLATVGRRLQELARKSDTVSRMGGDEFVCVLPDMGDRDDILRFVEKVSRTIAQPIPIGEHLTQVSASIGIVRYPENGCEVSELLSNADGAMYLAKKSHREYAFYADLQTQLAYNKLPTSQSLSSAIANSELRLAYQPKIDLDTNELLGVEALVRWHSPRLGIVMPNNFIPSAESSGLIGRLTYATLDIGLDQIVSWRKQGLDLKVAFNLSARLLNNRELPQRVAAELQARDIPPAQISLEITETALASSGVLAQEILQELAERSIDVSIDDFGSGFTSFRYIRDINLAELKIDRLFVKGICSGSRDAAIVSSILMLAERLGIRVIAEGVETVDEWNFLRAIGCRCGQGFAIAKPMSAGKLTAWLQTMRHPTTH